MTKATFRRTITSFFLIVFYLFFKTASYAESMDNVESTFAVSARQELIDELAFPIAISGNTAVAGIATDITGTWIIEPIVFVHNGIVWEEQARLNTNVEITGFFVDISGNTVVVGVVDDGVYIFERNGTNWTLQETITVNSESGFGYPVAISGDTLVVGVTDDGPASPGAAYIFARNGTTWEQQARLSVGNESNFFGRAIAIDGDTVVVGAKWDDEAFKDAGAAYVFVRQDTKWIQQQKLISKNAEADDLFGVSVAVSGDTIVVGALFGGKRGIQDPGEAYVFIRENGTWVEQQALTSMNIDMFGMFGFSVAIEGDIIAVGQEQGEVVDVFVRNNNQVWENMTQFHISDYFVNASHVDISGNRLAFSTITTNGLKRPYIHELLKNSVKLISSDSEKDDQFGGAVSISSNTVAIGAKGDDEANTDAGATYIFTYDGINWVKQEKIVGNNTGSVFGTSITIDGDTMVVGATGDKAAYVFVRHEVDWEMQKKLIASDATMLSDSQFGNAVAISGNKIVVGDNANQAAYLFVRDDTDWLEQKKLISSETTSDSDFGFSVAINDNTVVIGDKKQKTVYVFAYDGTNWYEQAKVTDDKQTVFRTNDTGNYLNDQDLRKELSICTKTLDVFISGETEPNSDYIIIYDKNWNLLEYFSGKINEKMTVEDSSINVRFYSDEAGTRNGVTVTISAQPSNISSDFGTSVAIHKDTIVVGAPLCANVGNAYVFVREGVTWQQQAKLVASDAETGSFFGISTAINKDTIIIGANRKEATNEGYDVSGAAYIFVRKGEIWQQQERLVPNFERTGDLFGTAVAISGDASVVGTPHHSIQGSFAINAGAVYIMPTVIMPSPPGGSYPDSVSITFDCDNCTDIYYTIDDSQPVVNSEGLQIGTTTRYLENQPISIVENTQLKYFSVGPAGVTSVRTDNYIIDKIEPMLEEITSPIDGSTVSEVFYITGTANDNDNGAGIDQVEITIQDMTTEKYVNIDDNGFFKGFTDVPVWINAMGGTEWKLNTSNIAFVTGNSYTVTAHAIDLVGHVSEEKTTTFDYFTGEKALTNISLSLNSQTILQNGSLDIIGKLERLPDIGTNLFNETVTLTVIAPDNSIPQIYTAQTDELGNYNFKFDEGNNVFRLKGSYMLQVLFKGNEVLLRTSSEMQTVLVGSSAGYAVIIQGSLTNNEGMEAYNKTLNRIYQRLLDRGFEAHNIYYFNYDNSQSQVDAVPSKAAIQKAITEVGNKINGSPAPLYIFMVDHGNPESFFLGNEIITPTDLNDWLDEMEDGNKDKEKSGGLNEIARVEPRVIVIGACYSGSFIPTLSKAGRTIITSAAAKEVSYKGLKEKDGIRSGEFFIEEFSQQLWRGLSLQEAFSKATASTETFTRSGLLSANTANPYLDDAMQHPLLDDNGDGTGSNVLSADGEIAKSIFLGAGVDLASNDENIQADILTVTPPQYLTADESTALLFLTANDQRKVDPAQIAIRPPSKLLHAQDGTEQVDIDLENQFLKYNPDTKRFEITYTGFTESGMYEIFYTVRDSKTKQISLVQRSAVYKNKPGNSPPNAFNLKKPAIGEETLTALAFDWEPSIDPDGDLVSYNLFIAEDESFKNEVIAIRNLKISMHFVNEGAGLQDLTPYYWKVEAVDSFGAITASEARRFNTNNGNRGYTAINLAVRSDLFAPVCVPKNGFQFKHNGKVIQPDIVVEENCGDHIIIFSNPKPADYDVEIKTPNYNPYKKRVRVKSKVTKVGTTNEIVWLNNDIQQEQIILNRLCHPDCDDRGSLELLQANTTIAENGRTVTLYVQRIGGYNSEVAVAYNFNGGNAEFGSDYSNDTGMTGTLSWGDGDGQTKSITVPISDDNIHEGNETFNVNLSTPSGGAKLGGISQTIVTVVDDDAVDVTNVLPPPENEQCDKTTIVTEPIDDESTKDNGSAIPQVPQLNNGNLLFINDNYRMHTSADTFTMRVARINGSDGEIAVEIATEDGTAKANNDYVSTEELFSWADGNSEDKYFIVELLPNSENVEKTFTITLHDPNTLEEIGSTGVTIVAALDDSLVAEPVVGKKPVIDPNGNGSVQKTTICPTVENSPIVENNGPKCTLSVCEKLVKEPKPSTLQFSKTNYLVNEGDGEFTIEVGRINGSDGEMSVKVVPIAGDGMATLGEDYRLEGSATLTWEAGNVSTQTVTWLILDDEDYEGNETAVLGLSVVSGNVNFADSQPVVLTIVDNDIVNDIVNNDESPLPVTPDNYTQCPPVQQCPQPRSGQFRFVETIYEVSEDAGTVQIEVARPDVGYNGCQGEILLEYVVANESTATLNSDYTHPNFYLNKGNKLPWQIWQSGECGTKPINLNIIDDQEFEGDEKLVLQLLEVGDGVSLATSQQTELTIVDNDTEIVPEPTCLLPSLGEGIVEPDKSEPSENATTFAGGIATDNCYFQIGAFLSVKEQAEIKGEIMIPPAIIGKTAEILMFATYKATPTAVEQGFMKVGDEILAWDISKTATVIKAAETVTLEAKQAVNIYTGFLPLGELKIYFGYRLPNESAIIFNGEKPIRVMVED